MERLRSGLWNHALAIVLGMISLAAVSIFALAFIHFETLPDGAQPNPMIQSLGKAALAVLTGAVISTIIKLLVHARARERERRDIERALVKSALHQIKEAVDIIETSRLLIRAQRSAKTYREQMLELTRADVILHNVRRSLRAGDRALDLATHGALSTATKAIKVLIAEFATAYPRISQLQSADEEINKERRKVLAQSRKASAHDFTASDAGATATEALDNLRILTGGQGSDPSDFARLARDFHVGEADIARLENSDNKEFELFELVFRLPLQEASAVLWKRLGVTFGPQPEP